MNEFLASAWERRYYENENLAHHSQQRLFLVYYPIISGYNGNKWGVTETSIARNVHSAVNKPVVVYRKNPGITWHTKQAGAFVHPTPEEAAEELGHFPEAKEYFQWQERFAVGRVHNVEKRKQGYAFTLEITDPEVKEILRKEQYSDKYPGWTSPQILFRGGATPNEVYDDWIISHIALLDRPAYGYDQSGARAKCLGLEKECLINTRNASQSSNLGFCIRQATLDLLSSHDLSQSTNSHKEMSTQESSGSNATGNETVTYSVPNTNTAAAEPEIKAQEAQNVQQVPTKEENKEQEQSKPQAQQPQSLEQAQTMITQMTSLIKDLEKTVKTQGKELEQIRNERKQARLAFIIPRDLFKSDESHMKEVQKTMNDNVSEEWLSEYWKTKRELYNVQQNKQQQQRIVEQPIAVKSASVSHEVPNYSQENSSSQNTKSIVQKQLELSKMILSEGGI